MKILLSAGHGGADSGSIGADKGKEKDRTINLTNKVASYLRNAGHSVTVRQEKNSSGDWSMTNRKDYDYALSIHFNAYKNGQATGTECFYKGTQKKASNLSSKVAGVLGINNRGAKNNSGLYMMNIGFDNLLEVCFHDNSSDLNKYNANIDKVAKAIADVINSGSTGNVSSGSSTSSISNNSNSIVDYLNSIGVDSSFSNRQKLAQQNGISNYTGTASQNLQLLNILRNGNKTTTTNTSVYAGNSIVDYLNSIGQDSSFANRAKLAKANGISNYTGTASQNLQLLNILRGSSTSSNASSSASYYAKYTGTSASIVDALKAIGIDSSFNNRKSIASKNGISNYTGTASQNTTLLNLLKQGKLKK